MPQRWKTAFVGSLLLLCALARAPAAFAQAPDTPEANPATALREALMAACRQNQTEFARYLTAENAATFQQLPAEQRLALMKRFVLLDDPGRPLLSNDSQGRTIIHCETPGITGEIRFGETRAQENLAFISVEVRASQEPGALGMRVQFGLVREGGGWKLLSVGLLLLNLAELSKQWESSELEAREKEAIATLRKFADAVGTYRRAFGKLPETLAQLGPAPKEGISPDAAGLLDAELAAGKKRGYLFRYRLLARASASSETNSGFELAAVPAEYGKTGRRSFYLDASGTLRGADKQGALATAIDPRIEPR